MRTFPTGATRDIDVNKIDPEGFLSPIVLLRYSNYMNKHRTQPDGDLRSGDNWQKGMPRDSFARSMWRHFLDFWLVHRGWGDASRATIDTALCGIIFNAMGYLHEILIDRDIGEEQDAD